MFKSVTSRNRRRAHNTDFGIGGRLDDPVGTSLTALTCIDGRTTRSSAWPILERLPRSSWNFGGGPMYVRLR
jgi:hypothetical protein